MKFNVLRWGVAAVITLGAVALLVHRHVIHAQPAAPDSAWNSTNSTRLVIWRPYGKGMGTMQVCTGDTACQTLDNGASVVLSEPQPYYLTLPKPGAVQVTPAATRITYLDPNPAPLVPGTYEDDTPALVYSGSWAWQKREGPTDGHVHTALDKNSQVTFTFQGSGVEIGMVFYDDRRRVDICVDGVCRSQPLYSTSLNWRQPVCVYGLEPGLHHVTMRLIAGKAMDLDWVRVLDKPADGAVVTSYGWNQVNLNGKTTLASIAPSASFAFDFHGKSADLDFDSSADTGEITLCIDAVCRKEDLFSAKPATHSVHLEASGSGLHHVVVEKGPSRWLALPAIATR